MSKLKSAILSLGARGTLGSSLTFQKRAHTTIVRKKPVPAYRYTLPQAYQRWLYQDYAYLWTQQSQASKQTYATAGTQYHLTGFQYWMQYCLINLPDIAGWWRLDNIIGGITPDSSHNENTGTIYGASPAIGLIDRALYFDGINDRVVIPNHPTLQLTEAITIEAFIYLQTPPPTYSQKEIVYKTAYIDYALGILAYPASVIYLVTYIETTRLIATLNPLTLNTWYHAAVTYDRINIKLYLNGNLIEQQAKTQPIGVSAQNVFIGAYPGLANWWHGIIDNAIIYNRALDATEVKRHSQRRYPP